MKFNDLIEQDKKDLLRFDVRYTKVTPISKVKELYERG